MSDRLTQHKSERVSRLAVAFKEHAFARARVVACLTDQWLDGKLTRTTLVPEKNLPALKQSVIDAIPGAAAAMGDTNGLVWNVCNLIAGKLVVQEPLVAAIRTGGRQFVPETDKLLQEHTNDYETILLSVPALGGQAAPAAQD